MSYEGLNEFENDALKVIQRLDSEVATLRCLVTALIQQAKSSGGQKAVDDAVAIALNEAKELSRRSDGEANTSLIREIASGLSTAR
ncbi:TPA: hypothetical protein ACG3DQ_002625 [Pseudomonas putida]